MILPQQIAQAVTAYRNATGPHARGAIYANELSPLLTCPEAITAVTNSLGTLSGDIVVQRALELMVNRIPLLTSIATDLSSEGARFNQTVTIRTVTPPEAKSYNTATGYASSDAVTTDFDLTLNQHKHVQVEFHAEELSGTNRDLFGEQTEAIFAGLGGDLAAAVLALITPTNFPTATTCGASNFVRSTVIGLAKDLTSRQVPSAGRFLLLGLDHFAALSDDPAIVALATMRREEILTGNDLPNISGFVPYEVASLPTTNSLAGFAAHKTALLLAVRPANDYSKAFPGLPSLGGVSIVTEPRTGLSCALVRFVDHKLGKAFLRVAWMYGVGVGIANAGQRLVVPS